MQSVPIDLFDRENKKKNKEIVRRLHIIGDFVLYGLYMGVLYMGVSWFSFLTLFWWEGSSGDVLSLWDASFGWGTPEYTRQTSASFIPSTPAAAVMLPRFRRCRAQQAKQTTHSLDFQREPHGRAPARSPAGIFESMTFGLPQAAISSSMK